MKLHKAIEACSNAAEKHKFAETKVRRLFFERYGADFSDIDCDPVIDMCNGQGNPPSTLEELDVLVFKYNDLEPLK